MGSGSVRVTSRYFTAALLAVSAFGPVELAGGPSLLFGVDHGTGIDQVSSGDLATLAVGATVGAALRLSRRWRISAELKGFRAALGADFVVNINGNRTVVLAPTSWTGIAAVSLEFVAWP